MHLIFYIITIKSDTYALIHPKGLFKAGNHPAYLFSIRNFANTLTN